MKRPGQPKRRTRIRPRGPRGSAFPKQRDPKYMAYLKLQVELGAPCDGGCGRCAAVRAHGIPRSRGGPDRGNVALLCFWCDQASEKRWPAWIKEHGVDLFEKARAWDRRYEIERLAPLPF